MSLYYVGGTRCVRVTARPIGSGKVRLVRKDWKADGSVEESLWTLSFEPLVLRATEFSSSSVIKDRNGRIIDYGSEHTPMRWEPRLYLADGAVLFHETWLYLDRAGCEAEGSGKR